jgi:hypothetical protein
MINWLVVSVQEGNGLIRTLCVWGRIQVPRDKILCIAQGVGIGRNGMECCVAFYNVQLKIHGAHAVNASRVSNYYTWWF